MEMSSSSIAFTSGFSSAPERAGGSAAVDSRTARLASLRGGEQQRARVEVDFRNVPEGVDVRMAPGATADLDLRMGLALTGGV